MKTTPGGWYYHPKEAAFCGYSGSGKTTLIRKLTAALKGKGLSVSFLKHDAHFFEMDKEGKDTYEVRRSGAQGVLIQDKTQAAVITDHGPQGLDQVLAEAAVILSDVLIIEGNKNSPLPKFLLLDPRKELDGGLNDDQFTQVLGVIGPASEGARAKAYCERHQIPFWDRDDVEGILGALLGYWNSRIPPLYGLVLTGGFSTRMGRDKAALQYRGAQSEALRAALQLQEVCEKVFISCRSGQQIPLDLAEAAFTRLDDQILNMGPLGGILTAFQTHPQAAWLVVGCDMPLLEASDLRELVSQRRPTALATAFGSDWEGTFLPEPLCAVYEPKARPRILGLWARGVGCPRWVLRSGGAHVLAPSRPQALFNANHPEDEKQIRQILQAGAPS